MANGLRLATRISRRGEVCVTITEQGREISSRDILTFAINSIKNGTNALLADTLVSIKVLQELESLKPLACTHEEVKLRQESEIGSCD